MLKPMLMSTLKVMLKPMSKSEQMEKLKWVLEQLVVRLSHTTLLLLKDQEQSLITEYIQRVQQLILIPTQLTLVTMVVDGIMRIKDAIVMLLTGVRHI